MNVYVVIPAAGLGTRMAGAGEQSGKKPATLKQFAEIGGAPIIIHALRRFVVNERVREIVVALRGDAQQFQQALAAEGFGNKVRIVTGGDSRQQSVANGLAALQAKDDDLVLVHDAVRPFVDDEIINSVIEAAGEHGAAIAGIPAVDTIKHVDRTAHGAIITSTIPRERVVQAQTPQGFRFGLLKRAFDDAAAAGFAGTDEASLVERIGETVHVVMGSIRNIKITTPADLELAEFFLSQSARRTPSLTG